MKKSQASPSSSFSKVHFITGTMGEGFGLGFVRAAWGLCYKAQPNWKSLKIFLKTANGAIISLLSSANQVVVRGEVKLQSDPFHPSRYCHFHPICHLRSNICDSDLREALKQIRLYWKQAQTTTKATAKGHGPFSWDAWKVGRRGLDPRLTATPGSLHQPHECTMIFTFEFTLKCSACSWKVSEICRLTDLNGAVHLKF